MILNELEQKPLYQGINFSLQITDPGSLTARTADPVGVPLPQQRRQRPGRRHAA